MGGESGCRGRSYVSPEAHYGAAPHFILRLLEPGLRRPTLAQRLHVSQGRRCIGAGAGAVVGGGKVQTPPRPPRREQVRGRPQPGGLCFRTETDRPERATAHNPNYPRIRRLSRCLEERDMFVPAQQFHLKAIYIRHRHLGLDGSQTQVLSSAGSQGTASLLLIWGLHLGRRVAHSALAAGDGVLGRRPPRRDLVNSLQLLLGTREPSGGGITRPS